MMLSTTSRQKQIPSSKKFQFFRLPASCLACFFVGVVVTIPFWNKSDDESDSNLLDVESPSNDGNRKHIATSGSSIRNINLEFPKGEDLGEFLTNSSFDTKFDILRRTHSDLSSGDLDRVLFNLRLEVEGEHFDQIRPLLAELPNDSRAVSGMRTVAIRKASGIGEIQHVVQTITDSFGPGDLRNQLLTEAFTGSADGKPFSVSSIETLFEGLEFDSERDSAARGLSYHLSMSDSSNQLELLLRSDNPDIREASIRATAFYPTAAHTDDKAAFERRLQSSFDIASSFSDSQKNIFWRDLVNRTHSGEQAFSIYDTIYKDGSFKEQLEVSNDVTQKIASLMTKRDPIEAIDRAVRNQSNPEFLVEVVSGWIDQNVNSANSWYRDESSELESSQQDQVAAVFARKAIELGDPDTAREWAKEIGDPEIQSQVLSGVKKE